MSVVEGLLDRVLEHISDSQFSLLIQLRLQVCLCCDHIEVVNYLYIAREERVAIEETGSSIGSQLEHLKRN